MAAQPATIDLGSRTVRTWAYGESVPGPVLRTTAGDLLRVEVTNRLPAETSIHFHGVALSNDMDGVPGITQDPIRAGTAFVYEFTTPDPGTYFFHPHSGVQLDRGLYGVLVVEDPAEPGDYDQEWIVVLDDWIDGTGQTPDDVLAGLVSMSGMGHGGMMGESMHSPLLGGAGDVDYPLYLLNGRTARAPVTLTGKPGQRARLRIVNAGSDTAFRVALADHRLTVTHSDGFPVEPVTTDALLIGMGERYDVIVDLADGVFPLVATPGRRTRRAGSAAFAEPVDDVPPHAPARAHLRSHRGWGTQGHGDRAAHAVHRGRPRGRQPRPVGAALPQHLPRRGRHDDRALLPAVAREEPAHQRRDRPRSRAAGPTQQVWSGLQPA